MTRHLLGAFWIVLAVLLFPVALVFFVVACLVEAAGPSSAATEDDGDPYLP